MDACGCDSLSAMFDRRVAQRDLARYRRSGPDRTTRLLLELIGRNRVRTASILDIGGGIGIIDRELLLAGAGSAVLVDASASYLEVARQLAREANLVERIEFVDGDFVRRAADIDRADIVTLDRVICCYPDVDALVGLSADHANSILAVVLPRDRRLVHAALRIENLWLRLRRRAYRAYAHSNVRVDDILAARGLRPRAERVTPFWRVAVFERASSESRP